MVATSAVLPSATDSVLGLEELPGEPVHTDGDDGVASEVTDVAPVVVSGSGRGEAEAGSRVGGGGGASEAGADGARHRAIWAYDGRLAHIARSTREPTIGQMRLAWWNDVIDDASGTKGQGEPVIDAMRATGAAAAPGLVAMIDGWEILVVEPAHLRAKELREEFFCAMDDDFNTALALASLFSLLDFVDGVISKKQATIQLLSEAKKTVDKFCNVLGLNIAAKPEPDDVKKSREQRNIARSKKLFNEADEIRDRFSKKDIYFIDTPYTSGTSTSTTWFDPSL